MTDPSSLRMPPAGGQGQAMSLRNWVSPYLKGIDHKGRNGLRSLSTHWRGKRDPDVKTAWTSFAVRDPLSVVASAQGCCLHIGVASYAVGGL